MDSVKIIIICISLIVIIVCTDIITYIIKVEKLETKTEKRLLFFQTLLRVLFYVLNNNNVSINSKNIRNTTFSISDRYGFNSI